MGKTVQEDIAELRSQLENETAPIGKLRSGVSDLSTKIDKLWKKVFGNNRSAADDILTNSDTIRGGAHYAFVDGVEPNVDGTGAWMSGSNIAFGGVEGNLGVSKSGTGKFLADTSGNVRAGSDVSAAASTAWMVFSIDQTYNSELMGAGDMLLGDNSSGKANVLWDMSDGQLKFRTGTTVLSYIGATFVTTAAEIAGWTIDSDEIKKLSANVGIILNSADSTIKVGDTGGNYIVIDGANQRIRSSNYVVNSKGFNIDASTGDAEFNKIKARGSMETVVIQNQLSVINGDVLVLPGDTLASDLTALDASTLTILGGVTFAVGDILRMRDGTNDEWLEVTSIASAPTYSVTRDKAGAYGANANPAWKAGQAVANYMQSGHGGVLIVSGATPKISCFTHAGSPWTTITEQSYLSEVGAKAGAGAVTLDVDGIGIASGAAYASNRAYKFTDGGIDISSMWATTFLNNTLYILTEQISGKSGELSFYARSPSGYEAFGNLGSQIAGNSLVFIYWNQTGTDAGNIEINKSGADIDTLINGDTTTIATFDAGLEAVGFGGAAESGYIAKFTGNVKVTGNMSGRFNTVIKTSDESIQSNTTLSSDSALTFTALANQSYAIRGRIWFDTPAAADFKFRFAFNGASIFIHHVSVPCGSATETVGMENASPTTTVSVLGAGTAGGYIEFDGKLVCDSSDRPFVFQWAQNTSTASNTTVKAGSYIEWLKVE